MGTAPGREPSRRERLAMVLARDGARCVWCARPLDARVLATTEHVVPRLKGGPSWIENEVAACARCNRERGHRTPAEWLDECERRGWQPDRDTIVRALLALRDAIAERGGQRRARPYLASQLRRLHRVDRVRVDRCSSGPPEPGEPAPIVRLASRPVYANPWIEVREDRVRFPDGHEGIYGVVTGKPATGVLPFVDGDHVLLVRQYRYVIGRATWEMPTGAAQEGEAPEEAVQRELAEETGHRARRLRHLHSHCTSKSILDEWAHLYLAEDLVPATAERDPTEFLEVARFRFDDVLAMVLRSEIVDAMTVVAVLLADRLRGVRGSTG